MIHHPGPVERAILDTSVIIAGDLAPIPGVLAISAITLAELQFGVLVAKTRPSARNDYAASARCRNTSTRCPSTKR